MPIQVLVHLIIAFLWMFLQDEWSVLSFISGYFVGIIVLFMIRRFFPTELYFRKLFSVIKLILVFISELITSSILVTREVIQPKVNITPGIFALETDLEGELEITMLALLLSLTPGSVVLEITPDNKVFYIHALNIPESSDAVFKAQARFEAAIKEVTRK
ncbi:Na+/H+ antiporter subunit E [Bacillus massiliglaciei]|uniref:Na+/H+ antiporter subunit E n=1 Tax=Bacillus massiliglaciei TaxID=1816693 RepID=UPI000DA60540|nr:Na+/H+ antiporter subunit E [Bacillus massiliglaciei]